MKSKRSYVVLVVTPGTTRPACQEVSLDEIMNPKDDGNDWEYMYCLSEMIDEVLDMQVLDVLPFKANRYNDQDKGVIIRKA
jgi:hypothetical protein